jgi:uncharacterized short protein YbdD (DUF466 family)
MICRCFGHALDVGALRRGLAQAANLMVGLPDYEAYLSHHRAAHPEQPPLSREAFFRNRQAARYGSGRGLRCC